MKQIKLEVPKKNNVEEVSEGNHFADLTKPFVHTEDRAFADFLIREHGLTEIGVKNTAKTPPKAPKASKVPKAPKSPVGQEEVKKEAPVQPDQTKPKAE